MRCTFPPSSSKPLLPHLLAMTPAMRAPTVRSVLTMSYSFFATPPVSMAAWGGVCVCESDRERVCE